MIPREILKKIRQIELRTNRIVNETRARTSFQTAAQLVRIPCTVKNGDNRERIVLDREVNTVSSKSLQANLACAAPHPLEDFRLRLCAIHRRKDFFRKLLCQIRRFSGIPSNSLKEFGLGFWLKKGIEIDHQPKRCLISASTCFKGIPRRGFFSNSARRRSSSAACSEVRSGSIPSSLRSSLSRRANSIRSASGRAFTALNSSIVLIAAIYSANFALQAAFFGHTPVMLYVSRHP